MRAVAECDVRPAEVDDLLAAAPPEWLTTEQARRQQKIECEAIDARWAPEVTRVTREARRMVDELSPERVGARIDREQDAARMRVSAGPPSRPGVPGAVTAVASFEVPDCMAVRAFRFTLDPTPAEAAVVWRQCGGRRYAYNWAVGAMKVAVRAAKTVEHHQGHRGWGHRYRAGVVAASPQGGVR